MAIVKVKVRRTEEAVVQVEVGGFFDIRDAALIAALSTDFKDTQYEIGKVLSVSGPWSVDAADSAVYLVNRLSGERVRMGDALSEGVFMAARLEAWTRNFAEGKHG